MEYQDDMHAMISLFRLSALESCMYASTGRWGKTCGLNPTFLSWRILYLSMYSCFSKHLHEYVSGTSWYSWLAERAPWRTAENHRTGFLSLGRWLRGLQIAISLVSMKQCKTHPGWVGCNQMTRQIFLQAQMGRSGSSVSREASLESWYITNHVFSLQTELQIL